MHGIILSCKLRLSIAREHDYIDDYSIRLLISELMCHAGSSIQLRSDVTTKGSLGMQIGSTVRNKRGMALKFILCSLNIYRAFNKRYINDDLETIGKAVRLTKGTSRRIADLIGGI